MATSIASIRRHRAYAKDAYTYYPVVIVGAGESGIAMGCRLKEALGFDQFRIFERQSGIGGTWWINRYPGVACDVPAVFYSFSFAQNKRWTTLFPPGSEIAEYLADVCAKYGIVDKIQLNTEVKQLRWLEDEEEWEVTLAHLVPGAGDLSAKERQEKVATEGEHSVYVATEIVRAKIAVSAVGGLVEPKSWPQDIPGIENFEGDLIHTARWKPDVNLEGKDVVVVGTGCSAAQVVPELVNPPYNAKSVTQLMRSPPWVSPHFSEKETEIWDRYAPSLIPKIPGLLRLVRFYVFCFVEHTWFQLFANNSYTNKVRPAVERQYLEFMRKLTPPQYHDMLTPNYQIGCKRRIIGGRWYKSLNHPKIELTSRPLKSVQLKSVTLGPSPNSSADAAEEVHLPADAIILANGYETNVWLHPLRVLGKNGKSIHDVWEERGGPQAYLGIAMDKFPNFFMIFGPNTATGHSSVIMASENAVEYSLKFIKPILNGDVSTWEVKEEVERKWTQGVQAALKRTAFHQGGCTSWYKNDKDWNSTVYP
ncbi:Uncharacterized protein T310_0365 [Rasamsonia emersonii CBS 393.64]|uniref:Uncharacterized protein n=1 Tax=Rasamsonia emersonii (strain ATCC 16479 / CBS 393.64 / IMI 116815) TaxID=1408163 RepID=A0A0F4Z6D7_RASE3|nr:Uncharacterized protein T310_0365 [Rasamsonia emersonii CBS 393.64]KKA25636.1 Uncharacterized protein T310_0365 [Rasamsonia emersonii CBS 393.64]